jgi:uncharacterized protein with von Willebrand factor type A (vWA) domain
MVRIRYSRWDGRHAPFTLEGEAALDELSRYLWEGLDLEQSLEWMRYQGFELAGLEFRVMGIEELVAELRQRVRDELSRYNLEHTFDPLRERLDRLLDREEAALVEQAGLESERWNRFRERRDRLPPRLSDALDRFGDHEWADAEAEQEYRELLEQRDDLRALEEFQSRNRTSLQGPESLDFEQALELMRRVQALSQLARDLLEGNFEEISADELSELLGEQAAQSILILRDLESALERAGYLQRGERGPELTPRAIRRIGELALEDIYAQLQRGGPGPHETAHRGAGLVTTERSSPYHFGGPSQLDVSATLRRALARRAERPAAPRADERAALRIEPDDLIAFDTDQLTETTTVLLLDMSWSMSWSGRWPAAKRVAVALDHLIRTRYPRDHFFVVGFYTRARQLSVRELAELTWNMSDPFTNLQEGLRLAERLIDRHPSGNPQIIVVTDGQPTAYFVGKELRVEWPNGYGGTSPRANRETLREVRRITRKGITINTFMLDDSAELMRFVESMTRINRGRAFYTTPGQLGEYVMVDYLSRKRRRIG